MNGNMRRMTVKDFENQPVTLIYSKADKMYTPFCDGYLVTIEETKRLIKDLTDYLECENVDEWNNEQDLKFKEEQNKIYIKESKPVKPSYLYLMKSGENIKIGISQKPNEDRLKYLAIGADIELIFTKLFDDAFKEEERLHGLFIKKRVYGEWYSLNKKDIDFIKAGRW